MTMTDERRRELYDRDLRRRELEMMLKNHVCAECHGPLVLLCSPDTRDWYLACGQDRSHTGFARERSWAELWRAGEPVPMEIAEKLENKYGRRPMDNKALATMPLDTMLQRIDQASFPQDLKPDERKMLATVAITYSLDPLMGELTIFQGHPYVSIDGRYRKAQETGLLAGVETRPATQKERKDWDIPDGDYFFRSEVYVKDVDRPFVGWGRVREVETKPPSDPRKRGYRPLETNPQRMAEKRAEAQALRKAFHIPLPSAEDVVEDVLYPEAIEGEARKLPDEEPAPQADPETGEVAEPGPSDTTEHPSRVTAAQVPHSEEAPNDAPQLPPDDLPMTTMADLFNACQLYFGMKSWAEILRLLSIDSKAQIADVADAWATVKIHKLSPEE